MHLEGRYCWYLFIFIISQQPIAIKERNIGLLDLGVSYSQWILVDLGFFYPQGHEFLMDLGEFLFQNNTLLAGFSAEKDEKHIQMTVNNKISLCRCRKSKKVKISNFGLRGFLFYIDDMLILRISWDMSKKGPFLGPIPKISEIAIHFGHISWNSQDKHIKLYIFEISMKFRIDWYIICLGLKNSEFGLKCGFNMDSGSYENGEKNVDAGNNNRNRQ